MGATRRYWAGIGGDSWNAPGYPPLGIRSGLTWGTYLPGTGTVGITSAPTITQSTNITYSDTSGSLKLVQNTEFLGQVFLTGANYWFKNCKFTGPLNPTTSTVSTRYATANTNTFEDCTFNPRGKNYYSGNITGRGFTCYRCDFYGSIDGVDPAVADGGTRVDVALYQCWIHDLMRYCPDPTHTSDNQSHSDAIQWAGGLGLTLRGNRIEGLLDTTIGSTFTTAVYDGGGKLTGGHPFYPNPVSLSGVMVNAYLNTIQPGELIMQKNWIRGGTVGMDFQGVPTAWGADDGITIVENNWWLNDQGWGTNNRMIMKAAQTMTIQNNYKWILASPMDTGTAVSPRVNN